MIFATHHKVRIDPEAIRSLPNLITALRSLLCLGIFSYAAYSQNPVINLFGLLIHWLGDGLDGFLARWLQQETVFGAQIDILADRIHLAFFYFNCLTLDTSLLVPVILFIFNFLVLDHHLSNQYLRWGIISPNYFYKVDELIWRLNWSQVGKFINTGPFALLVILTDDLVLPTIVILIVIGIKSFSLWRLISRCNSMLRLSSS